MTRVWICATKAIARAGLESIIRQAPFEILGSSSNLEKLLQFEDDLQPDVILLEWLEGDEEFFGELLFDPEMINSTIVVLSDREDRIVDLLSMNVRGILPRSATAEEIISAVAAAAAGLIVLHPDFAEVWLSVPSFRTQVLPTETSESLTQREIEVLQMLAQGLGNKAIASRLSISEHTVKFHISSIFTKLNASSRTEAVMLGLRQGFIML
ncbi:response regulator transcription factor [Candidatus Gracilibacteria bacterium]|nr:response regulator transcription factor [Candidatus Gracilibacteria bacterium]NJM90419.1 response regulator transcription factor [Hydrococcus sp. RU_2_2]NJP17923.1 response regulator transcription factor [Hydrococcus sp. CRU_1_1]NJQ98868.1 response regulator transcription factor [Hydrococcus sp. CSU_1_8]